MKLFILLGLIAACSAAGDLRVRFGLNPFGSFFIHIPLSITLAVDEGWLETTRPEQYLPTLVMYCNPDYIICALYDDNEDIAGLQIGLPTDQFTGAVFDWPTLGFTEWNPPNASDRTFWTIQQYFVSEEYLATDKDERKESRTTEKLLQEDAVWVTGFNKELVRMSTALTDIEANGIFTKQACIILMGRHYYYNMTAELECNSDTIFPWFGTVGSGILHGTALMVPGVMTIPSTNQDWFEKPTRSDVEMIVPDGPECLYELAENPGVVTMHIYYVDNPYLIHCISQ